VLGLRYIQDMRLAEIGEILGVTESRICQLHAKAVLQVRAFLPEGLEPVWG
jgi:RNA polymerase sigma factor for flagellar operon FliA